MKRALALAAGDLKNIVREPMLLYIMSLPIFYTLLARYLIPLGNQALEERFQLEPYYGLIAGFFTLFTPVLLGMVTGFLLLDERDEQVMMALIVTPLARQGYLAYRIALPVGVGFIYSLLLVPLLGLVEIPFHRLVFLALLAGLEAPLTALFLVNWAGNKVEGLALSKGLGLLMLAPLAGMLVDSKWSLLAGIIPFYWPVLAVVTATAGTGGFWLHILAGLTVHLVYLLTFIRRFTSKVVL